jgi:hypothetical protein
VRYRRALAVGLVLGLLASPAVFAQTPPQPPAQPPAQDPAQAARLRVFLDCYECDLDYLRQTVGFVDYMRERTDADLHVLVTTQSTGGGGRAWTIEVIGLGRFVGHDHVYQFSTPQTATSDERRREFARMFKISLVDYSADTAAMAELDVTWRAPAAGTPAEPQDDPWDYWVFRTNASGNSSGEQLSSSRSYRFSFAASRVTEAWKITSSVSTSVSRTDFTLDDGSVVESERDSWSTSGLVVKSLGPKWSIGGRGSMSHSSFSNTDRAVSFAPGIEFDFFPYAESTRRSLTVQYTIGAFRNDYREITVFDKLSETVPNHSVIVSLGLRQPWGSLGGYTSVSQHLNHTDRYRMSVSGSTDVRLFRGFSFNVYASYDKIRDQISLQKGSATRDEVLLRLRQLSTNYSYYLSFGFSYSFGSIYNNIVNPRFGGTGAIFFF